MTDKEVAEIINEINSYLYKTIYEEVSFSTMLKVDKFLMNLKENIRLKGGLINDRTSKGNGTSQKK